MSTIAVVSLTYAVTVTTASTQFITNTVTVDAGAAGTYAFGAVIAANGWAVYLPVIRR
jgi:hypothetical protein